MNDAQRALLQELLRTYGPCGHEDAVREIVRREIADTVDETWVDEAGNLVGLVRGSGQGQAPVVRVMAHLDELSMIVKRIDGQGQLTVVQLGMMYPGNFGLGPVTVLGDTETLTSVLVLGSEHTTKESIRIWQTKPDQGDQALDWNHVYVFTGRTPDQLAGAGVHAGTRVAVHESKRTLVEVGDYLGCYFLDDRAAVVVAIEAARQLREAGPPPADVYFVFTTSEEMGGIGASYASRALPGQVTLALDVGPAEDEYQTTVNAGPIVAYADDAAVYDKQICDRLMSLGAELDLAPTAAVFGQYESDASNAKLKGQSPRAALLALPTLSTHGYEVIHRDTIDNCAQLLAAYLRDS